MNADRVVTQSVEETETHIVVGLLLEEQKGVSVNVIGQK